MVWTFYLCSRVTRISNYGDSGPLSYDLWCCGCLWSDFWLFIKHLPQHTVPSYSNCTASVKYKHIWISKEFSLIFFLLYNRCVLLLKWTAHLASQRKKRVHSNFWLLSSGRLTGQSLKSSSVKYGGLKEEEKLRLLGT